MEKQNDVTTALADPRGGARDARPPWGSKFFHFHAVFGKKLKNNSIFGSWRPPWGKSWIRHWTDWVQDEISKRTKGGPGMYVSFHVSNLLNVYFVIVRRQFGRYFSKRNYICTVKSSSGKKPSERKVEGDTEKERGMSNVNIFCSNSSTSRTELVVLIMNISISEIRLG